MDENQILFASGYCSFRVNDPQTRCNFFINTSSLNKYYGDTPSIEANLEESAKGNSCR